MEFFSHPIVSNDFRRGGSASQAMKECLKRLGADADAVRRAMIAAYEAEMNVVIHAVGGRLEASVSEHQVEVNVIDEGPGMPDVELAMTEGYSTASAEARALGFGAGMGLPNIRRSVDRLRVTSRPGVGTRVSFTVNLHRAAACSTDLISLYALAARCRECRTCLTACPTQAMRVRGGRPVVLEHLCIDCTNCIAACTSGALTIREEVSSLEDIAGKEDMLLAVPPALLAGCGPAGSPAQAWAALERLGFAGVVTVAPFEEALREAALERAGRPAASLLAGAGATLAAQAGAVEAPPSAAPGAGCGATAEEAGERTALIVPSCPAVVNLIRLRFPALLPALAPFKSPWEALRATYAERAVAFVISCPAQRSALLARGGEGPEACDPHDLNRCEYLVPELVRQALMLELSRRAGGEAAAEEAEAAAVPPTAAGVAAGPGEERGGLLRVTGLRGVVAVLEQLENGLLDDVLAVEPYACEGGCFGSPLLAEEHHVAERRWNQGRSALAAVAAGRDSSGSFGRKAAAVPIDRPFSARPGIRLDPDMGRAIEKLGRLQELIRSLPGKDCGLCGAPSCAALAEDVVMERADVGLCPYAHGEEKEPER